MPLPNGSDMAQAIRSNKPKTPPTLTSGTLSPVIVHTFIRYCNMYLASMNTADADKVSEILICFHDDKIGDWIDTEGDRLRKLSIGEFFKEFRSRWLPERWADDLKFEISRSFMRDTEEFAPWKEALLLNNNVLKGYPQHMDDTLLRAHFETHVCQSLREFCYLEGSKYPTLEGLLNALAREDIRRRSLMTDLNTIARRMNYQQTSSNFNSRAPLASRISDSKPSLFSRITGSSSVPLASRISAPGDVSSSSGNNNSRSNTAASSRTALPRLTDAERRYLAHNGGCFKCRRPNVSCTSATCTTGFPDARTYRPLVPDNWQPPAANPARTQTTAAINAIDDWSDEDDFIPVAAFNINDSPPARFCSVLDGGDTTDEDKYVVPLTCRHITWDALVHSPSQSPTSVRMLIDSGAPAILVDDALVSQLGLRRRPLHEHKTFGTAWGSGTQVAKEWVKFRVSNAQGSWSSRTCRAIVVKGLFVPVILGLPFYAVNECYIDPLHNTLVRRCDNVDILRLPAPVPPTPPDLRSPRQRRDDTREAEQMDAELRVLEAQHQRTAFRDTMRELKLEQATTPATTSSDTDDSPLACTLAAVRERIESIVLEVTLARENERMRKRFVDLFPDDIPHIDQLPTNVYHRFRLKDPNALIARRQYDCPKKYRDAWKTLLNQHLAAGRIRASSSPYASPSFLIPKADPTALPRWVNDYRALNANTVPDVHPLPLISDILADCAKGQFWAKIDMTNSFFQTRVHPDDVPFTAVNTPFGLYEWTVMPQGCRNAPATHQRRMFAALRDHIGTICHVYLDDIVIWSQSLEEHRRNVATVLEALREHSLYCSPKKTDLFCIELDFLGHRISRRGVEADEKKVEKIVSWPIPKSVHDVQSFLGIVRYIANFLPKLAEHTVILTELTRGGPDREFCWTDTHTRAFQAIKDLVISRECLTVIDHQNMGDNKIFVACDASEFCSGAVLSFGPTLQTARPVAFDSQSFKAAELNYPVHEKELFAIIRALRKWRSDLLGVPIEIYTDHKTLENFDTQKNLSRRQARWQEFLAHYDYNITYIKGEDHSPPDSMSRHPITWMEAHQVGAIWEATTNLTRPPDHTPATPVAAVQRLHLAADEAWIADVLRGYAEDEWCKRTIDALWDTLARSKVDPSQRSVDALTAFKRGWLNEHTVNGFTVTDGLLYTKGRLVIPRVHHIREQLFRLAHDSLGHFGADKTYAALRSGYFWPGMRRDVEELYVPGCEHCQRNKNLTRKPAGPLHPLPVPDTRCESVALDFVGPLPEDNGYNCIATITCRLNSDFRLIPTRTDITAEDFARLFFDHWYCENGLPLDIFSDRDKLFVSKFWRALAKLTKVELKMSTSYHPETDGASERTNKTIIQAIRFHVERNQRGWSRALPLVRFNYMSTHNASSGFTPFHLRFGRTPRVIPPLLNKDVNRAKRDIGDEAKAVKSLLSTLECDIMEAQDNLLLAKTSQAYHANKSRSPEIIYNVGDQVLLSTFHRRRDYIKRGDNRVAKFMVRYDGPWTVVKAHPEYSAYTLDLPDSKAHKTFHASLLRPFIRNDAELFNMREYEEPGPIATPDGLEHEVDRIIDHKRFGRGFRYLVHWRGFPHSHDRWRKGSDIKDLHALDVYLRENGLPGASEDG